MKSKARVIRKFRIRKKVSGTEIRPRLTVFKSLKTLYVQAIDDVAGNTICSALVKNKKNIEAAKELGKLMSDKIKEKSINEVVFDRNGYRFHGVIKILADTIRENGIKL
jgi:large subunit ribosomal protein L18